MYDQAHRNRLKQGGVTQTLPSLDYNVDQLFFIAYSQASETIQKKLNPPPTPPAHL